jgi:hypothetical protein
MSMWIGWGDNGKYLVLQLTDALSGESVRVRLAPRDGLQLLHRLSLRFWEQERPEVTKKRVDAAVAFARELRPWTQ